MSLSPSPLFVNHHLERQTLKDSNPPSEDPNAVIQAPGGVWDIGFIDADAAAALGVSPGPIRLLCGYQGRRGWGWLHLTQVEDRMRAIRALGYSTAQAFVFAIAANWTEIHQAAEPDRLKAVWLKDGYELAIVLQWTGAIWSVTTALPFRPAGKPVLYVKTA